jgi:hypothetical protein
MGNIASRFRWVFGVDPYANDVPSNQNKGKSNNVVGTTGAGVAFNTFGWGENFTFYVETTDSAATYQIRTSRTSSGPWAVLSSGTLGTTAATDIVQLPGPFMWLSPRVKTMGSTSNNVIISMTAVEA